jgi:hypothetical protein
VISRPEACAEIEGGGHRGCLSPHNGWIHDFVLLNVLRNVRSTEAAIEQASEGLRQHLKPWAGGAAVGLAAAATADMDG